MGKDVNSDVSKDSCLGTSKQLSFTRFLQTVVFVYFFVVVKLWSYYPREENELKKATRSVVCAVIMALCTSVMSATISLVIPEHT